MTITIAHVVLVIVTIYTKLIQADVLWSDEFEGKAGNQPSSDKWRFEIGDGTEKGLRGWGNSELQYYTDSPSNAVLDGQGNLVITAHTKNSSVYDCYYGECRYTSARLVSKFDRKYGHFEARIKVPTGKGIWPTFWMLGENVDCVGWPNSGEIDVMELRGSKPSSILGTIHGPGYSGREARSSIFTLPAGESFGDNYHVFAVDWEANRISWSVDGDVYVSRTPDDLGDNLWVFDHPFNIILNVAVGGDFDGEPTDTNFPKSMYIDYIRVHDKPKGFSINYEIITSANTDYGALIWSSEFNEKIGSPPPADLWNYDLTDGPENNKGWGNSEQEYYTNETANCATDGQGNLVITARTDNVEKYSCYYGPCRFTSARLATFGKFSHTYGRFEARIKTPAGKGLWPAFWILGDNMVTVGWPQCGAISIMEAFGSTPSSIISVIHGPGYQANSGIMTRYTLPGGQTFDADFHVFALDWEPDRLTFSVDGNEFRIITTKDLNGNRWVFDHNFHILLNLAVGGADGYPPPDAVFPKMLYIDYVRVYDLGISNNVDSSN